MKINGIGCLAERRNVNKFSISNWIREEVKNIDWTVGTLGVLDQLKIKAKTKVPRERYGNWDYKHKRLRFDKFRYMKTAVGKKCIVCGEKENVDRHHIISLFNGGVTIRENLIAVCRQCHSDIHQFEVGKLKVTAKIKKGDHYETVFNSII